MRKRVRASKQDADWRARSTKLTVIAMLVRTVGVTPFWRISVVFSRTVDSKFIEQTTVRREQRLT